MTRAWIGLWLAAAGAAGAGERHWAYVKPTRPAVPAAGGGAANPIDRFVGERLNDAGLTPSPRADRAKQLRRLSLTLIGLPPTPAELDAFLADRSAGAYGRAADRLLASPRFGEHWARHWLDLARYADSNGYQADQLRDSWAYRDWVIDALNHNKPFGRFVTEQLAGDLLPSATDAQRIATGFHRAVPCNVEAGVHPEANRVNQVFDRVNTTGTVFLGTTLECAQCHDHKYDPFPQKDYYQLFAFFNNTPLEVKKRSGVQFEFTGPKMGLPEPTGREAARRKLRRRLKNLQAQRAEATKAEKKKLNGQIAALNRRLAGLAAPSTLVMVEMSKPRPTHVMRRGDYLDPGERVAAGVPGVLHGFDESLPKNRLGLAKWLVDPANPLMARVTVNRWWAQAFGRGLVDTPEDFGTMSPAPSHPELLDWLAVELVESAWSMKHIIRLIVTSDTFRRSSRVTSELIEADPENRLYARGPRFRLPAEALRDNALAAAGLLAAKMHGPPVMPYQPAGLWKTVGRNQPKWVASQDEDRFRRGVYVVWRRAAPYPSFTAFDAPDRAACTVKRPRTNTPLQALMLLNDRAFAEAALGLAQRIIADRPDATAAGRAAYAFRLCTSRRPRPAETRALLEVYRAEKTSVTAAEAARRSSLLPAAFRNNDVDCSELGAWFAVANVLLNLDETITLN